MTHPSVLNNFAVHCISTQDYDEAITTLTKSLRTVKLIMSGDAKVLETIITPSQQCNVFTLPDGFKCDFVTSGNSSSFQSTVEKGGMRSASIFRAPIYMDTSLPQNELANCELLSYVILYNLALSYHLRAMCDEDNHIRNAYIEKALTLYEHAHHILTNKVLQVSLLHPMAIASNLGHIHSLLGDEPRAQLCFRHLLSTIVYVVNSGRSGERMEVPEGFFRNVMPLMGTSPSAPAA